MATSFTRHNPLDFFLWGYVKEIVYRTKVNNLQELKERISAAIESVQVDMLENTWREMEFRLDALRATIGDHIELV